MSELMEEVWVESGAEIGERINYVARGGHCRRISRDGNYNNVAGLMTDHEEADKKIAYLAKHAEDQLGRTLYAL